MEIQMLEDEQALHVVQRLTYHNRTGTDLESVMFNLYANISVSYTHLDVYKRQLPMRHAVKG